MTACSPRVLTPRLYTLRRRTTAWVSVPRSPRGPTCSPCPGGAGDLLTGRLQRTFLSAGSSRVPPKSPGIPSASRVGIHTACAFDAQAVVLLLQRLGVCVESQSCAATSANRAWSWRVAAGQNTAFDKFACQVTQYRQIRPSRYQLCSVLVIQRWSA